MKVSDNSCIWTRIVPDNMIGWYKNNCSVKVRRDPETQFHMSRVAREGYRREGRGSVGRSFSYPIVITYNLFLRSISV